MTTKEKQTVRVYNYMKEHGGISQRDAITIGCYRLSARIHDLRREGHLIMAEKKPFDGKFGKGYFTVYSLVE